MTYLPLLYSLLALSLLLLVALVFVLYRVTSKHNLLVEQVVKLVHSVDQLQSEASRHLTRHEEAISHLFSQVDPDSISTRTLQ